MNTDTDHPSRTIASVATLAALVVAVAATLVPGPGAAPNGPGQRLYAAAAANVERVTGPVTDNPTVTITNGTATTSSTPTTAAKEAHVLWQFGTVTGTYTTCTAQTKTAYDGTNFVTLGGTAALTVTSNTVNAWDIYQQAPVTTGVTVTAPSAAAGTGFGQLTQFVFSCASYGTSAPVTVTVIYR